MRTTLHKCDVTYVVSPAYKGGRGSKSPEILQRTMCTPPTYKIFEVKENWQIGVGKKAETLLHTGNAALSAMTCHPWMANGVFLFV